MDKEILITKASGEKELFSEQKLLFSLRKSGAPDNLAKKITEHIKGDLKIGMKTSEIHKDAFSLLKKQDFLSAARYSLKQAIMDLGPEGHAFEKFVGEILKSRGFITEVAKTIQGICVSHEVDVSAQKDNRHILIECKFHNQQGIKTDVKVALYIFARFQDINKKYMADPIHGKEFHEAWLVTNTKLTSQAIKYANCVGMRAIGWNYPKNKNLQNLIEESGLHPLTCLTKMSRNQKKQLLFQGIVLCKDLLKNTKKLKSIGLNDQKIKEVMDEINNLCYKI